MKTVRFYDLMVDCVENGIENGIETTRQLAHEFRLDLPEDFDLCDAFPILCEKTRYDIWSFRYENV